MRVRKEREKASGPEKVDHSGGGGGEDERQPISERAFAHKATTATSTLWSKEGEAENAR